MIIKATTVAKINFLKLRLTAAKSAAAVKAMRAIWGWPERIITEMAKMAGTVFSLWIKRRANGNRA